MDCPHSRLDLQDPRYAAGSDLGHPSHDLLGQPGHGLGVEGVSETLDRTDEGLLPGTLAEGLPHLESYARVHHLMADVVAELAPGVDACDVLAALFPGGSVTGAPKLAAMRWIAELEREARGFFCGSLGFADTRGRAAFNILIRTLLWRPRPERGAAAGELSFRVGGGITWSSDAAAEERETLDKAAGAIDALSGSGLVASRGAAG